MVYLQRRNAELLFEELPFLPMTSLIPGKIHTKIKGLKVMSFSKYVNSN